jgi:hypothetical protein
METGWSDEREVMGKDSANRWVHNADGGREDPVMATTCREELRHHFGVRFFITGRLSDKVDLCGRFQTSLPAISRLCLHSFTHRHTLSYCVPWPGRTPYYVAEIYPRRMTGFSSRTAM